MDPCQLCKFSVTALEERRGGCFYRPMQALSDEQQTERLERKVDEGFAEMRAGFQAVGEEFRAVRREIRGDVIEARSDARSDFRTLIAVNLTMLTAVIFGFAGIVIAMLIHT
jgi:hypothetical protein